MTWSNVQKMFPLKIILMKIILLKSLEKIHTWMLAVANNHMGNGPEGRVIWKNIELIIPCLWIFQILVHSSALNAEKNRCTNLMCAKIATKERKETSSFHVQTANSGRQERNLSFVKAVRVTPRDRPLNQLPLKLLGQHGQVGIQFEEKVLQRVQNLYIKMTLFQSATVDSMRMFLKLGELFGIV